MTKEIKKTLQKWRNESKNSRNDGYSQEEYKRYIKEVRDYANKLLSNDK